MCFFFCEWYGDHRDLHLSIRRQRQMCIRDRHSASKQGEAQFYIVSRSSPPWHGFCLCFPWGCVAQWREGCLLYPSPSPETSQDLVCRLLLEQNNRNYQQPHRNTIPYTTMHPHLHRRVGTTL